MTEGTVVIVDTGQAGTIIYLTKTNMTVLLSNGYIWYGQPSRAHEPTSREELDAVVTDVDTFSMRRVNT